MPTRERRAGKIGRVHPKPVGDDGGFMGTGSTERSAHRLYAEVVWTTADRLPLIAPDAREPIEAQIIALCRRLDVEPVAVRVTSSRARLLIRFKPAHSLGAVVTALKLGSQDAATILRRPIRWGRGFAVLSLSGAEVRRRALRLKSSA